MPACRRHRTAGGAYVVTVALADRRSDRQPREAAAPRAAATRTRRPYPFRVARGDYPAGWAQAGWAQGGAEPGGFGEHPTRET